jgi:hypothetical protein
MRHNSKDDWGSALTSSGVSCTLARCQSMKVLSSLISDQDFLASAPAPHLQANEIFHACPSCQPQTAASMMTAAACPCSIESPTQRTQHRLGIAGQRGRMLPCPAATQKCVTCRMASCNPRGVVLVSDCRVYALVAADGRWALQRLGVLELLLHVAHQLAAFQAAEAPHEQLRPHLACARHRACNTHAALDVVPPCTCVRAAWLPLHVRRPGPALGPQRHILHQGRATLPATEDRSTAMRDACFIFNHHDT